MVSQNNIFSMHTEKQTFTVIFPDFTFYFQIWILWSTHILISCDVFFLTLENGSSLDLFYVFFSEYETNFENKLNMHMIWATLNFYHASVVFFYRCSRIL